MKMIKLTFNYEDESGKKYKKTLDGESAEAWYEGIQFICNFCDKRGVNPDWGNLNWKEVEIKEKKKEVLECSKVLEEILENNLNK